MSQAGAQGICLVPEANTSLAPDTELPSGGPLVILAGPGVSGNPDEQRFPNGIEFTYQGGRVVAARAVRSLTDQSIEGGGSVTLEGRGFVVFAEDWRYDEDTREMRFRGSGVNFTDESAQSARASADEIVYSAAERRFSLTELSFTTCPEDRVAWEFRARLLTIDEADAVGILRGATLRFKNVPVFKTPYFSVPLDDRRKSGFLTPKIAERDRIGFDVMVPYYLNLAPNYDLLLEPRYMEDRGTQIGSRFRYLMPRSTGELDIEYQDDDRVLDRSRYFVDFGHETLFGVNWVLTANIENVSDAAYFEDLGENLGTISQTHLERYVDLAYYGPRWSLITRAQEYQTIDNQIAPADRPYERLPQMLFHGRWGDRVIGFESLAEAVKFDRTIGETGWRLDTTHELSLRFTRPGYYVTPAIGFRQTNYHVDGEPGAPSRSLARDLPVTSLDAGLKFERTAGSTGSWIQTIEPRLLYVRIPYEDQTELPVFDTIVPDFNLVQLFSKYQFVGGDRVADTDQVSVGLTTRLIQSASGRERLSATLGQTRYRDPRRVLLPGESSIDSTRSDYVAELLVNLSTKWNMDVGYQWNGETEETVRAETRFEYRPEDDRLFGVGYRMRDDLLEQGDLSLIWPVTDRWRVIGQYSYSLLESKPLERFAGIEFEACCWRLRVTNRHYIVRSTGETDSTISFELELKGLARNRATPEELLGRVILGSRLREQAAN
jgi:LPS-assembly protein